MNEFSSFTNILKEFIEHLLYTKHSSGYFLVNMTWFLTAVATYSWLKVNFSCFWVAEEGLVTDWVTVEE